MKLLDDLFANVARLEAVKQLSTIQLEAKANAYRAKPTPRLLFWASRRILEDWTV